MVQYLSREDYDDWNFIIYVICLPIICLIGLIGNSFSLYILRVYPTNHAFCSYLKTLTCTDTLLLTCGFLRSLFRVFEEANVPSAQKLNVYGTYGTGVLIGSALQRMSSSLITVIAIERVLVVVYPLKVRSMAIERHPVWIILFIVAFFSLMQLPTFAILKVDEMNNTDPLNTTFYLMTRTEFARSEPKVVQAYLFILAILGIALPLLIVIISTVTILLRVKMQLKGFSNHRVTGGSIETERMTLTLVTMAIFFTILSVPAAIIYVWSAYDRSNETLYLRALFTDVDIVLVCINSACDFIIYCLASNKFRSKFLWQICSIGRGSKGGRASTSDTTNSANVRTVEQDFDRNSAMSSTSWVETGLATHSDMPSTQRLGLSSMYS